MIFLNFAGNYKSIMFKQGLLPVLTYLTLALLIIIQVSLISRAARLEEQNFNYRVAAALNAARDEIGKRVSACPDMHNFLCKKKCAGNMQEKKHHEVDSIIRSKLLGLDLDLPYTFEVIESTTYPDRRGFFSSVTYLQDLTGLLDHSDVKIKVLFPSRAQFILWQIKGQIGLSILFIIFVAYSFVVTYRMLKREKSLLLLTTDFINNMAHELQTPIANIRLATRLIKRNRTGSSDVDKTDEYAGVILEESRRLQNHVESILKAAHFNLKNDEVVIVDINSTINSVIITFKHRLESLGAVVQFTPSPEAALVACEPASMEIALSNLLDNALKYVSAQPEIFIETLVLNKLVEVKISDNGIGIKKEHQQLIFDKFFRAPTGDVHDVKGFGLGLTYVKNVVLQAGGSISVESLPLAGSTFKLKFPLANDSTQKSYHPGGRG